jgi:hypothetical protein
LETVSNCRTEKMKGESGVKPPHSKGRVEWTLRSFRPAVFTLGFFQRRSIMRGWFFGFALIRVITARNVSTAAQPEHVPELAFRCTDGGRTSMEVFRRAVKAGEAVDVPQGNWTGGLLVVAPEK